MAENSTKTALQQPWPQKLRVKTHLCVKRILDSVNRHTSICLNFKEVQELRELRAALEDQFICTMENWDNAMHGVEDDAVFNEFEDFAEVVISVDEAAGKALAAHNVRMGHEMTAEAALPDSGETKAMPPVAGETGAVLPDSGGLKAMSPVAGETEAVLPDSGGPKAMSPVAGETEAVWPDSGVPKAMSPVAGETEAVSPDSRETEAVLPMARFPAHIVKLIVERDMTPEAMTPEAVTIVARAPRVVSPVARETQAVSPVPNQNLCQTV